MKKMVFNPSKRFVLTHVMVPLLGIPIVIVIPKIEYASGSTYVPTMNSIGTITLILSIIVIITSQLAYIGTKASKSLRVWFGISNVLTVWILFALTPSPVVRNYEKIRAYGSEDHSIYEHVLFFIVVTVIFYGISYTLMSIIKYTQISKSEFIKNNYGEVETPLILIIIGTIIVASILGGAGMIVMFALLVFTTNLLYLGSAFVNYHSLVALLVSIFAVVATVKYFKAARINTDLQKHSDAFFRTSWSANIHLLSYYIIWLFFTIWYGHLWPVTSLKNLPL